MTMIDKLRSVAVFLTGALIPAAAVISATSTWAVLGTPHLVIIMLLGGSKAIRDLWSHAPNFGNADKLKEEQLIVDEEDTVVEVEEKIAKIEAIQEFQDDPK